MTIRCFIAIRLEQRENLELSRYAERLKNLDRNGLVRWVQPENYHATLAFLGDIEESKTTIIHEKLLEQLGDYSTIEIEAGLITLFPAGKHPRVVAALIKPSNELLCLYQAVETASNAYLSSKKHPFKPHITLGRLKRPSRAGFQMDPFSITIHSNVQSIDIFKSELFPNGPKYTLLNQIELKGHQP